MLFSTVAVLIHIPTNNEDLGPSVQNCQVKGGRLFSSLIYFYLLGLNLGLIIFIFLLHRKCLTIFM